MITNVRIGSPAAVSWAQILAFERPVLGAQETFGETL